jgi:hypothetical protein
MEQKRSWASIVSKDPPKTIIAKSDKTQIQTQPQTKPDPISTVFPTKNTNIPNNIKLPHSKTNVSIYLQENWENDEHGEQEARLNSDV